MGCLFIFKKFCPPFYRARLQQGRMETPAELRVWRIFLYTNPSSFTEQLPLSGENFTKIGKSLPDKGEPVPQGGIALLLD